MRGVVKARQERFPAIDLENRGVWEWAFQHRQAMEARIDNWSTMPLLPADTKQGTAGTLAWEVSKQASRSAKIDPVTNIIAVAAASLGFAEIVVKYVHPATSFFVDTLMAATKPPTMP